MMRSKFDCINGDRGEPTNERLSDYGLLGKYPTLVEAKPPYLGEFRLQENQPLFPCIICNVYILRSSEFYNQPWPVERRYSNLVVEQ